MRKGPYVLCQHLFSVWHAFFNVKKLILKLKQITATNKFTPNFDFEFL